MRSSWRDSRPSWNPATMPSWARRSTGSSSPGMRRRRGSSAIRPEEIIGKSITTIIPPELHAEERHILERLRRGERIDHFDTVRMRKDGRRVHLSITVSPIRDASGTIVGASKIARDISERKAAELAYARSSRRSRQAKRPARGGSPQGRVHGTARPRAAQSARADPLCPRDGQEVRSHCRATKTRGRDHRAASRSHEPPAGRSARHVAHHARHARAETRGYGVDRRARNRDRGGAPVPGRQGPQPVAGPAQAGRTARCGLRTSGAGVLQSTHQCGQVHRFGRPYRAAGGRRSTTRSSCRCATTEWASRRT